MSSWVSALLFFGVLAVLQRVLSKFPSAGIPSIADDMTLVGPQLDVTAVFVELKIGLGELVLALQHASAKLFARRQYTQKPRNFSKLPGYLMKTNRFHLMELCSAVCLILPTLRMAKIHRFHMSAIAYD